MYIENGWRRSSLDESDLFIVNILYTFELGRCLKISVVVNLDPMRLVQHYAQFGVSLRDIVDCSVR